MLKLKQAVLTIWVLLIVASIGSAHEIKALNDPVVGRLIQLVVDVDVVRDESGLPSHTIEWDSSSRLMEFALQPSDNVLILPTGVRPSELTISVRVIDWDNRRITRTRKTFSIKGEPGAIEPIPDDPDPPIVDADLTEFANFVLGKLETIGDVGTAKALGSAYRKSASEIEGLDYQSALKVTANNRSNALLSLDEIKPGWNALLASIATEITKVSAGDVDTYSQALLVLADACESVSPSFAKPQAWKPPSGAWYLNQKHKGMIYKQHCDGDTCRLMWVRQ